MSAKRRGKKHVKRAADVLRSRAQRGFHGYPIATIAHYGPDDKFASKAAVGIILEGDKEAAFLERWFAEETDVRVDAKINQEIVEFIRSHSVRSVAITDRIIGCPHEEGIDYPRGESCPRCPYWAGRDMWTGDLIAEGEEPATWDAMVLGIAWYKPDQWGRLRQISVDADKIEPTYQEWLEYAEEAVAKMQRPGTVVRKVAIDVEDLLRWCTEHGRAVDASARAEYTNQMLRERYKGNDS